MAMKQATQGPRHDGGHAPQGAAARFLNDPAKVGFAALLLASVAALEGWLLWNKLRDRAPTGPIAVAPAPGQTTPPAPTSVPAAPPTALPAPSAPAAAPTAAPTAAPSVAAKPSPPVADKPVPPAKAAPAPALREPTPAPKTQVQSPPPTASAAKPGKEDRVPEKRPEQRKPSEPSAEPKRPPRKPEPAAAPKPVEPPVVQPAQPTAPPVTAPRIEQPSPAAARTLEPISRAPLRFPIAAVRQGVSEGKVKARATIDAGGNVIAVEILNAYPQRLFDRAVTESISEWKFPPGADRRSYEVDVEFKR